MSYRGDIALGETITVLFTTRRFSTGAPFTLAGTPAISAYVDGGLTQITAGITLTADFDAVTGLNKVVVVATSGNGFATSTDVDLVITTGTVDSVSVVGEVIGSFSIENRSSVRPTVAGRTLDITATGAAGIDWANVENPTTALNLSGTNIDVDQVVASVSGAVGSVTGAVGSVTGAVGSVTGAVGSVAAGGIAATSFAAGAIDAAAIAADAIDDSAIAADVTAVIAAAVWNAATVTYGAAGSYGLLVETNLDAAVSTLATQASVNTIDDFLDTEVAAILADTNELQTDWVNGGRLDLLIDAIKAKTDNLPAAPAATGDIPTAAANADAVWDEAIAGHLTAGSTGAALNAAGSAGDPWSTAIPGAYGAGTAGKILGDNINATISSRASQTSLDTVDDFLDTEIAAILTDTNELQTDLVNGGRLDLLIDAIKAKTDSLTFTVAGQADANIQYVNDVQVAGTGASGNEWGPV